MSLVVKNSKALVTENMKWKILLVGPAGAGKTSWISTAPNVGVAACESGHGSGLLSIAQSGLDYVEPRSKAEFESFCTGQVFKDKSTLAIDSLTAMTRTFIKDHALGFARNRGNSEKRAAGVPELDDYQIMAEVTRGLISKILDLDKHIIITCGVKALKDADGGIRGLAPDLPGAMADAAPGMLDFVLYVKSRKVLRDPRDKSSEYTQRYLISENDGYHTGAKARSSLNGKSLLDREEIYDLQTGAGCFPALFNKIVNAYLASNGTTAASAQSN
jgi:hypothetical protein